jgi:endonuclease I
MALMAGLATLTGMWAAIPDGYYNSLDGKSGTDLISAMTKLAKTHTTITYNTKTWPAFLTTDVRTIDGKEIWWDMYSNNMVYTTAHDALNIEHAVANSWFGAKKGSTEAYSDLFHLNPSDQNANNTKSSWPPGITVSNPMFDNGLMKIGNPVDGYGDGATNVFEPADEYKGDFARAYFYLVTAYSDLSTTAWIDNQYILDKNTETNMVELRKWVADMLLDWSRKDPVDSKEKNRQEAIYALQKNRNPFIDYPELAEYLWGDKANQGFNLSGATESVAEDRPEAPVFEGCWMNNVNSYAYRYWNTTNVPITHDGGDLYISVDGGAYEKAGDKYTLEGTGMNASHTIKAYVQGPELRSPIATMKATTLNPDDPDYTQGIWSKCTSTGEISTNSYYILLSDNTLHAMSANGGSTTKQYMESAGFVQFTNDKVTELPVEAAIIRFKSAGDNTYSLGIYNVRGDFLGYWKYSGTTSSKNLMKLDAAESSPGEITFSNGQFVFTLSDASGYKIQFNKTQPRFLNYSSTQGAVQLYKFEEMGTSSAVEAVPDVEDPVAVSGRNIIAPNGGAVYDLNGRRVSGEGLEPGIYIVTGRSRAVKVLIK